MTTTHSNIYSLQIQIKWCILEDNGVHIVCTQTNVVYGVENAVSQWRRSKGREGEKGLGQLSHTCPPCRWPWSTGRPQRCLRGAGPWRLGKRRVDDKWVALHGVFMMQVTVPHAHTHTHTFQNWPISLVIYISCYRSTCTMSPFHYSHHESLKKSHHG
jgi:hypothetical protein